MKKFYILLVAMFVVNGASAQTSKPCSSCLPQGITFSTQSQIDNFQINYPGCTEIQGYVNIGGSISNLNGLSVLTSIGDFLYFSWSTLTSLTGLENLTYIGGSFELHYVGGLTSLTGLNNLTSIGGGFTIHLCPDLISLTGLEGITSLGGDLGISNALALTSLTGLENITSIGGDLDIDYNYNLTSLAGLENLTSIGGYLRIHDNFALTSLTGLENLTYIGGYLSISNDSALTSLTGLDNIESNTISDLVITSNSFLSTCAVQSICDYLANPSGTVKIIDNATGCNSEQEVEDACATLGEECLSQEASFSIYPNPASTLITIETPTNGTLSIHNTSGQQLLQQGITAPTTSIDVSGLKSGVYLVKVVGEKGVSVGKFIKQ